ncbi:hypothetical protein [Streptomyces griseosporeus]|uniref:hypothetical protein n=1 Tax=Streptomyces griseosporeus TaxID=1910 RepID=UPI0036F7CC67
MTEQTPRDGLSARQSAPQATDGLPEGRGGERAAGGQQGLHDRIFAAMVRVIALDRHLLKPEEVRIVNELTEAVLDICSQETERAETAEHRLRLAHQARRAKEHQLDGIRRALCDVGAMQDDDPYSHADLEGVIRQAFTTAPAHNAGPTVAECAEADARWWGGEKTGEGQ